MKGGNSILFSQLSPHLKKLAVLELLAEGDLYARAGHCVESLLGDVCGKHLHHASVDHHGGGRPPDGFHRNLGTLSALCGCVVASSGASCGIVYLMGGDYGRVCAAIQNMVANLTGMICDGAKPSCSIKICSGVSSALLSALLSMQRHQVTAAEGIVDNDVDKSIHNLTSIGKEAMNPTDDMVLDIMTHK